MALPRQEVILGSPRSDEGFREAVDTNFFKGVLVFVGVLVCWHSAIREQEMLQGICCVLKEIHLKWNCGDKVGSQDEGKKNPVTECSQE